MAWNFFISTRQKFLLSCALVRDIMGMQMDYCASNLSLFYISGLHLLGTSPSSMKLKRSLSRYTFLLLYTIIFQIFILLCFSEEMLFSFKEWELEKRILFILLSDKNIHSKGLFLEQEKSVKLRNLITSKNPTNRPSQLLMTTNMARSIK